MKKITILFLMAIAFCSYGQNKALVVNGDVKIKRLPSKFTRADGSIVWGAYQTLSDSIHYADGWRDIVRPNYNALTQRLGEMYYDLGNDVVTYELIAQDLPALDEAKAAKVRELREAVKGLYNDFVWLRQYYELNGEQLPAAIKLKAQTIRTKYDQFKALIESQTSVVNVMAIEIPYEQIETLREQIDAIY